MGVVRGDRIGESQRLNRCSLEAQEFYALFISAVPDDFGRYRHSKAHIAIAMYPRREPTRAVLRRITRLLAELEREKLIETWEVDGVKFGEISKWRATGNRYHRTPEPPGSPHVHGGACLATAIHRAKEWGMFPEAQRLSLLMKDLRERKATGGAPGGHLGPDREGDSPSSPSSPSSPTDNEYPPDPPASAGGPPAPDLQRTGDLQGADAEDFQSLPGLDNGRQEVPAPSERDLRASRDRLVTFAAKHLGYRFDRAARRALLDRLKGGETEAQLRATYESTLRELEETDAEHERPPPREPT